MQRVLSLGQSPVECVLREMSRQFHGAVGRCQRVALESGMQLAGQCAWAESKVLERECGYSDRLLWRVDRQCFQRKLGYRNLRQ